MRGQELIAKLRGNVSGRDENHFSSMQLLTLYDFAKAHPGGTYLELGTDRGQATNAILAACEEVGGKLVSVDIRDCSSAAGGPDWTFVEADSADRETVVAKAPILRDGIDMMYIDSLHTPEHVMKEIYGWFDLVKEGGHIYFDDVDSGPYLAGARKDNRRMEIDNRQIKQLLENVFYRNLDQLELVMTYGSTGLALLRKRSPLGSKLKPVGAMVRPRNSMLAARLSARFGLTKYKHKRDGSDFL